jgi:Tol biopolymer transport system component/DNA-binding winged helix-turn-helix (wHTH) protein
MQINDVRFYEFGEFRLDIRRRILTKNGEQVVLKNRHFELLLTLVENEGQILSQEELIEKVWDGAYIENSNVKKGISALRQILEESPTDSVYIKTVHRKGYSFVANIRALPEENENDFYNEPKANNEFIPKNLDVKFNVTNEDKSSESRSFAETLPAINKTSTKPKISTFSFNKIIIFVTALLIFIFVGVLSFVNWKFISRKSSPIDFSQVQIAPLTNMGNINAGNISRTGEYFYFATKEQGLVSLWLKNLKTGVIRQITSPQKIHIYASDFAPDDQSIYFWLVDDNNPERNGIYQVNITNPEMRKISNKEWIGFKFSPDGKRVVYWRRGINEQNDNGLFTANLDGSDEKSVFNYDGKLDLLSVDWSPDGRFLTYAAKKISANKTFYFIAQVPYKGGDEQFVLEPRTQQIFSALWMPDSRGLAVTALDENSKMQQVWYLSYPEGEWQRITNDLNWYWVARPTIDGSGILVSQQRDVFNLWVGDGNGQNFRQITSDTLFYQPDVGWIDDETLLFAAKTEGNNEIWQMSADGKERRQLTFDPSNDRYPQATQGGERILFLSDRSGTTQIWQMRHNGNDLKQVTNAPTDVGRFRILPRGETIIYVMQLPGRGWSLFKKSIDNNDFQMLPFSDVTALWDISPDGKDIAYLTQTKNGEKVRLSTLEENKVLQEFDISDFNRIVWAKDGKSLLYDNHYQNRKQIFMQPLTGGQPRPLTNFDSDENIWNFDISPNGKRIASRRVRQYLDLMSIKLNSK